MKAGTSTEPQVNASTSTEDTQSGEIEEEEDEDVIATDPTQVSGAFLVDCAWLEDDSANQRGIGGCVVTNASDNAVVAASAVTNVNVTFETTTGSASAEVLAGTATESLRFVIPYAYYGKIQSMSASFVVAGAGGSNGVASTEVTGLTLGNLPAASATSYSTGGFKLGDNGLHVGMQCDEIETSITEGNFGPRLNITFSVSNGGGTYDIAFERICGNCSTSDCSATLAHWELRADSGQMAARSVLPASFTGNAAPDMITGSPASSSQSTVILGNGTYTLTVFSAEFSDGLDDSVIQDLTIRGPGLQFLSRNYQ
jgi:hypothetical protein